MGGAVLPWGESGSASCLWIDGGRGSHAGTSSRVRAGARSCGFGNHVGGIGPDGGICGAGSGTVPTLDARSPGTSCVTPRRAGSSKDAVGPRTT